MWFGAGPVRLTRLTSGQALCAIAFASSSRGGITSFSSGSSRTARAVWPVNRHMIDIDMLVSSFDQIVSLICATAAEANCAASSTDRNRAMRSPSRSSHSPISSMLRSGERFSTTPGAITSLDEKITPPTMRSFGIAARKAPPGSRKERSGVAG